ncbi:hypothetical protein TWF506_000053 [Arthrobotrys conoides]|uniref:Uncharacterized protein n=1 Tax=Arthrobotrys conoides TaxID=74498 RepID=A0AAN8NQ87_9PEZI
MRPRVEQSKRTNYTSLLFILSATLSLYFASPLLKASFFSKGFGLLPTVRADDADADPGPRIDIPNWYRNQNPSTHSQLTARSVFRLGGRIDLYCYPSTGGYLWATHVSTVELDLLGLDRFKEQDRSFNETEEDAFCERFQLLDPLHDDLDDLEKYNYIPPPEGDNRKRPRFRHIFCWPKTGGAWVKRLTYTKELGWYTPGGDMKVSTEGDSSLTGAIWNARTMEERCQAFERAGGKFCAKLEDCEETKRYVGKKIWLDD